MNKKYFLFVPGRQAWISLTKELAERYIATPTLSLSDNTHRCSLKSLFPQCEVIDFRDPLYGLNIPEAHTSRAALSDFRCDSLPLLKDRCLKMMDRIESGIHIRRVDREALFYKGLFWSAAKLDQHQPDFLLFGEAPHAWPQYLFFELAKETGVPTFIFSQWGIAPALYLRSDLSGPALELRHNEKYKTDSQIEKAINDYLNGVDPKTFETREPDYMADQKRRKKRKRGTLLRRVIEKSLTTSRYITTLKNYRHGKQAAQFIYENAYKNSDERAADILGRLSGYSSITPKWAAIIKKEKLNRNLKDGLTACVRKAPHKPYVYFPLHYEPERTTLPDGGKYHDQISALIELRANLPSDIQIVVKEHPSQVNGALNGEKGRSLLFYDSVTQIENTVLIAEDAPVSQLFRDCEFVATISGSAALEAALLKRKSLIFGHAWFEGCPNVFSYDNGASISDILTGDVAPRQDVEVWLKKRYKETSVPGFQNPSGARRFWKFEQLSCFKEDEVQGMAMLLAKALQEADTKATSRLEHAQEDLHQRKFCK